MTTLDFVNEAAQKEETPAIARWGLSLQRLVARETLYLLGQTESLPSDFKDQYWAALKDVLSRLRDSTRLEVSPYLLELLRKDAPADMAELIESKTVSAG